MRERERECVQAAERKERESEISEAQIVSRAELCGVCFTMWITLLSTLGWVETTD